MAQDLTTTGGAPPASRPREIRVVESVSGIMDTSRFEHLGRVATVMAHAGLMPQSLTHTKQEGAVRDLVPLDFEVVRARAFLIANQADLWKADPNAIAQATSLVHGKLCYEGKLVHGLIETRLGVRLTYTFGTYDRQTRRTDVSRMPPAGDKLLGVLVVGQFDDEEVPREISGSVAMWHKGDKSPWNAEDAWPRQLRYMGAREWCRAHSPGLLLGIMTDDEIDAAEQRLETRAARGGQRGEKVDLVGRLAAPTATASGEGFDQGHVLRETARPVAEEEPQDDTAAQVEEGAAATAEADAEEQNADAEQQDDEEAERDPNTGELDLAGAAQDEHVEEERQATPEPQGVIEAFLAGIPEAADWRGLKASIATLYKTEDWQEADVPEQRRVRQAIWAHVRTRPEWKVDPGTDPTAFRCWMETSTDPDEVTGTFAVLRDTSAYFAKMTDGQKAGLESAALAAVDRMKGA